MNDFYKLISNVANKEMELVGVIPYDNMPTTARHQESVRRTQIWTFEELAKIVDDAAYSKMFQEMAYNISKVPDIDLRTGRPGTAL